MRPVGFSTGALAKGDVRRGVLVQRARLGGGAIELSALREDELGPLLEALPSLDLSGFAYVSVHAPGALKQLDETAVFSLLRSLPDGWPLVVHPELLVTRDLWRLLGPRLCIENMDNRKTGGRTVAEMRTLFQEYPDASFCLDVGHARQVDPTMTSAIEMLREFGSRLRQLHVSEVGPGGDHLPVGTPARTAFRRVASHVPGACPVIIESAVAEDAIQAELAAVEDAFGTVSPTTQQKMAFA